MNEIKCGICHSPLIVKYKNNIIESMYCERCQKFLYEEDKYYGRLYEEETKR